MVCKSDKCKKRINLNEFGYCSDCANKRERVESDKSVAYPCGKCKLDCTDMQKSTMCELCNIWHHIICVEIDENVYKLMQETKGIMWFCESCQNKASESITKTASLEAQTKSLQSEVVELEKRVSVVENKLNGSVDKEISEAINEKTDRERRKMNLVFYNFPEPVISPQIEWNIEQKVEADIKSVTALIEGEFHIHVNTRICDARRLGAKKADGKSRPLRVQFTELNVKRDVLSNAKKLRDSGNAVYKGVFINPDLTYAQRQKDRTLRDEMWRRRVELKENVVVKSGELVKVDFDVPKIRISRKTTVQPGNSRTNTTNNSTTKSVDNNTTSNTIEKTSDVNQAMNTNTENTEQTKNAPKTL